MMILLLCCGCEWLIIAIEGLWKEYGCEWKDAATSRADWEVFVRSQKLTYLSYYVSPYIGWISLLFDSIT